MTLIPFLLSSCQAEIAKRVEELASVQSDGLEAVALRSGVPRAFRGRSEDGQKVPC